MQEVFESKAVRGILSSWEWVNPLPVPVWFTHLGNHTWGWFDSFVDLVFTNESPSCMPRRKKRADYTASCLGNMCCLRLWPGQLCTLSIRYRPLQLPFQTSGTGLSVSFPGCCCLSLTTSNIWAHYLKNTTRIWELQRCQPLPCMQNALAELVLKMRSFCCSSLVVILMFLLKHYQHFLLAYGVPLVAKQIAG